MSGPALGPDAEESAPPSLPMTRSGRKRSDRFRGRPRESGHCRPAGLDPNRTLSRTGLEVWIWPKAAGLLSGCDAKKRTLALAGGSNSCRAHLAELFRWLAE